MPLRTAADWTQTAATTIGSVAAITVTVDRRLLHLPPPSRADRLHRKRRLCRSTGLFKTRKETSGFLLSLSLMMRPGAFVRVSCSTKPIPTPKAATPTANGSARSSSFLLTLSRFHFAWTEIGSMMTAGAINHSDLETKAPLTSLPGLGSLSERRTATDISRSAFTASQPRLN